jgi:hypothetical protein
MGNRSGSKNTGVGSPKSEVGRTRNAEPETTNSGSNSGDRQNFEH